MQASTLEILRDILHADVDYVIVWDVVKTKTPELVKSLRPIVESFDKNN